MEQSILRTANLSKNFGAVKAVQDVSINISRGEAHAIIGPNGAGKTTLLDLIINRTRPSSGNVYLEDKEITYLKPFKIVEMGVCKCYQITQLFPSLSCFENVQIPLIQRKKKTFSIAPVSKDYLRSECLEALEKVGMGHLIDEKASELSYGDKKRLEIAISLAKEPKVLLLDEPTAGVARAEGYAIMDMIQDLRKNSDLTVVFIEHDMDIVFNYADVISVMNHGALVATDVPMKIRENSFVKEAYLGGNA